MPHSRGRTHLSCSIFDSGPFELVVNGKSIYIHKAHISKISGPLDRLVNNDLLETHEGRAYLDDESEATLTRFIHWAYAGFYFAGELSIRPDMEARSEVIEETDKGSLLSTPRLSHYCSLLGQLRVSAQILYRCREKNKKPSTFDDYDNRPTKKKALKEAFLRLQFSKQDDKRAAPTIRANTNASEDYSDVFSSHARLYTFAEAWDIQPLKRLALRNLHQTLTDFTLWPECVKDVVTLLRSAYGHTARPKDGQEPMRSMLNQYITYEIDKMLGEASFQVFLVESRDFLDDFSSYMKSRI